MASDPGKGKGNETSQFFKQKEYKPSRNYPPGATTNRKLSPGEKSKYNQQSGGKPNVEGRLSDDTGTVRSKEDNQYSSSQPQTSKLEVIQDSRKDEDEATTTSKSAKQALQDKLNEAKQQTGEHEHKPLPGSGKAQGLRTLRIWHPNTQGKTLKIRIGQVGGEEDEGEQVFKVGNIQTQSFDSWSKQARMQLPSATGGTTPIESIDDIIDVVPAVQKETDPKIVQNTMKRVSMDANERRKTIRKDMLLARKDPSNISLAVVSSEKDEERQADIPEYAELEKRKLSRRYTVIEIESETEKEGEEEDREARKLAGTDIKTKLQTLRELTEHLKHKRKIRQQIVERATGHTVLDTEQIPLKEHCLYLMEYLRDYIHDFFTSSKFWDKSIIEINGRYGVVVASYFIWLRRIVVLNIICFLLVFFIICLPQIIEDVIFSVREEHHYPFNALDLLHGEHYLHHSYLFYSGYHNRGEASGYPLANPAVRFLLAKIAHFLVNVYFAFSHMSAYYQGIQMTSKIAGFAHNNHFISIICGWDFSCGDKKAASFLRKTIHRDLHILANAEDQDESHALRILTDENKRLLRWLVLKLGLKRGVLMMHVISNSLLIFCCFCIGTVMYFHCQIKLAYYLNCEHYTDTHKNRTEKLKPVWLCPNQGENPDWIMVVPSLLASLISLALNLILVNISGIEIWGNMERKVYATMFRAGCFYMTNLLVTFWFWDRQERLMGDEGFTLETIFGKELYRLVVIQGAIDIVVSLAGRKLYNVIRSRDASYKRAEFPTEHCAMGMFFLHSMSLISTIFCPMLGLLITIRLIIDFYRHRYALFHMHGHEGYASHASTVYGPYLVTFFITFLITTFLNIYYLSETTPSKTEGPFVNYSKYDNALQDLVSQKAGLGWIKYLVASGCIAALLLILLALVYFCREWSKSYEPIIIQLNDNIYLERADRDTLLKAIFEIGRAIRPDQPKRESTTTELSEGDDTPSTTGTTRKVAAYASKVEKSKKKAGHKQGKQGNMLNKQQQTDLAKIMSQVKLDDKKGTTSGRKLSVTVDTWNAQRHRRDAMEKIVKGIVGGRRNAKHGVALSYDPTKKIFEDGKDNSGSGSDEGAGGAPKQKEKTKRTHKTGPKLPEKRRHSFDKLFSKTSSSKTRDSVKDKKSRLSRDSVRDKSRDSGKDRSRSRETERDNPKEEWKEKDDASAQPSTPKQKSI